MSAIAGSSKSANEMYEIRDVGKKGKGMVAAKDISQGEIILSEKPILVVLAHGLCPAVVYNEYLTLNESDRARFRALSFNADSNTLMAYAKDLGNQHDKERGKIIAIFNTNCMEDQEHTKRYVAVECARMNHSCRPNTTYGYVHKDNVVIVRALQGIAKGDEIVIPYVPPIWTKKQRTEKLWSDWHFVCDCDACTSKTPGPLLSDKVSNELIAVDNKIRGIRMQARKMNHDPNTFFVEEQMRCCKFFVERTVSIKALIPDTLAKLEIYLPLLEISKQLDTSEAKKWFVEASRLASICRGPEDPFLQYCGKVSKNY